MSLGPLLSVFALVSTHVAGGVLQPRQLQQVYGGVNISAQVLCISNYISHPVCNATAYCVQLVTEVIPQCEMLGNDPGCWCGDEDPVHYCAICMASPTDNTTTPDQTQNAETCHTNYHAGCSAYETYINNTAALSSMATMSGMDMTGTMAMSMPTSSSSSVSASASSTALASHSSSSNNTGALVGGVVGGVIGLAIILAGAFLIYRHMQNKHEVATENAGTSRMSIFSGSDGPPRSWDPNAKTMTATTPRPDSPSAGMGFNPYFMPPSLPPSSGTGGTEMGEKQSHHVTTPPVTRNSVLSSGTQDYDTTMLSHLDRQSPPPGFSTFAKSAEPM